MVIPGYAYFTNDPKNGSNFELLLCHGKHGIEDDAIKDVFANSIADITDLPITIKGNRKQCCNIKFYFLG